MNIDPDVPRGADVLVGATAEAVEEVAVGTGHAAPLFGAALLIKMPGGGWTVPATTAYPKEAVLRDLIRDNPSMIVGVADPAVAAVEEFGVPGTGRIDVMIVEASGQITLVEAKLEANPEIRRKVLGQVFAYAAGLAAMSFEQFDEAWTARCNSSVIDSVLGTSADADERAELRKQLENTLSTGSFRLVVAVDQLTDELKASVSYLATHLDVDIVALELAYASHDGVEVLVPRSFGTEHRTAGRASGDRSRRRAGSYRATIAEQLDRLVQSADEASSGFGRVVRAVLGELDDDTTLWSADEQLLDPVLVTQNAPRRQPGKVITTRRTVGIRICFDWCRKLPQEVLEEALAVLESNPATARVVKDVRSKAFRTRPLMSYPEVLSDPAAVAATLRALQILTTDPSRSSSIAG